MAEHDSLVQLLVKPHGGSMLVEADPSDLAAARESAEWVWLDIEGVDAATVLRLAADFGLHELAVEDVLTDTEFPKVDEYDDHLFLVLHGLATDTGQLRTVEFDAFLGEDYLLTFHREQLPGFDWVTQAVTSPNGIRDHGPDRLLARLAEATIRRFLPLLDGVDQRVEELEEQAIIGHPTVPAEIMVIRRQLVHLRRVIAPQRDVFDRLRAGVKHVDRGAQERFSDVYDQQYRIVESMDSSRALLGSVLDTYRSTVAETMNEVMKVLTVFSAILLPLSLMAGIYGMNFANMPELGYRWAYYALLGVMAVTAIGLWVYFARRKFIGGPKISQVPRLLGKGVGMGISGLVHLTLTPVRLVLPERQQENDDR